MEFGQQLFQIYYHLLQHLALVFWKPAALWKFSSVNKEKEKENQPKVNYNISF
jgi:hypothetical protein